ncbi:hypothetical protein [Methylobacterium brachiatum]|uniref:hypothetical protein n=1 Tax=Methylobacterium brachiatum TaxID=269660 RepID=UPI000EFCCE9F|nr:hypothetical protein [Methylobacterium brachiatum]AYO83580.1 hypothetical protein EBB05_15770 [Methylobacterium brachiatum]
MVTIKGGSALEKRLSELAAKVSRPANLSVGFIENSTYPDGTSVPMVAAIQEFGAPARKIPPRPYFRNMIADKSPGWGDAIAAVLEANGYDATRTMEQVGAGIKGQLQQSIVDTNAPALSPATVARKGSAKPLVDTGQMLNSVDYKVE